MSTRLQDRYKQVQYAYSLLSKQDKKKIQFLNPYNRIKIIKTGDSSANAVVFLLNNKWIAKVNPITDEQKRILINNNIFISNYLCQYVQDINSKKDTHAKIVVCNIRKTIIEKSTNTEIVITFEPYVAGMSLQSLVTTATTQLSQASRLCNLSKWINQIKKTLYDLHHMCEFSHNDLHMGNIMIESSTNRPVIIDLDWSIMHDYGIKAKGVYQFDILRKLYIQSYGNKKLPEFPANGTVVNVQEPSHVKYWWFMINKACSPLMTTDTDYYIDMTMLINHLHVSLRNTNFELPKMCYSVEFLNVAKDVFL